MTVRVVVADDQEIVRAGFAALLETQDDFAVAGTAADGVEAVELCRAEHPDVVLMDVRMPSLDGIEATRLLAADGGKRPRILMLTTFDLDEYVYDALSAGASGFLLKDVAAETLFDAVRVVAAGEALLAPAVTRRLIDEFARLRPRAPARPELLEELTPRETEVLLPRRRGALERRDRRAPRRQQGDREDARQPGAGQAQPARPQPGGHRGLRVRPRRPALLARVRSADVG